MKIVILFLFGLISGILGDVSLVSPGSGKSFSGSSGTASVDVSWVDDDSSGDYSLSKVDWYSIVLCTGPGTSIECFHTITTKKTISSNKYTATFDSDVTGDGYYFLQVYAMFKDGDATMHYTNRFKLTGMSGSTASLTIEPTQTGSGPSANTDYADSGDGDSLSSLIGVAYTAQTDKTRLAPIQTQPGSSISYTKWSLRHPTSAYTPYTSASPSPNVDSTYTPSWNYTVTSLYNYATIQEPPTTWYNPSARATTASLSTAAKQKRWID